MLADLDALLAVETPTGPLVIAAHSAGTILATRWLLKASPAVQRVTRVIFIGGPPESPVPPKQSEMRLQMAGILETPGTPLRHGQHTPVGPWEDVHGFPPARGGHGPRHHADPGRRVVWCCDPRV